MARGITLDEFKAWVEKNEKHTWSIADMIGWKPGSTHLIKYFDLGLDTRTMDIFRIGCRGSCEEFSVHVRDDIHYLKEDLKEFKELEGKDNSILDLLDYKIAKMLEKRSK